MSILSDTYEEREYKLFGGIFWFIIILNLT